MATDSSPNTPPTPFTTWLLRQRTLLAAWLTDLIVPPTAEMSYETFHAIERIAGVLGAWRPAETEWASVRAIAAEQAQCDGKLREAHSSGLAPLHSHAMFGDFAAWPVYSALAAGYRQPTEPTWAFVAALFAWPYLGPSIPGAAVPALAISYRELLAAWLRESVKNSDAMAMVARLIGAATTPAQLLEMEPNLQTRHERTLWPALRAYAAAYCASRLPLGNTSSIPDLEDDPSVVLSTAIRKIIDTSIALAPENLGLAPEDAGAVRYVSQDGGDEEDGDCLVRHRVRLIASAREFNHPCLQWDALNPYERDILRASVEIRFSNPAQRTGAIGLAMCALLALDPAQVARLPLQPDVFEAAASLHKYGVALAWSGARLVALQRVPPPPCAYDRPNDAAEQLPHLPYVIVGIPDEVAAAIAAAGGQPGGDMLRHFPDLAKATRDAAQEIREATGARLHLGRIQRVVADTIFQHTLDECLSSVILPGARVPNGAGAYYSATPATSAFRIHAQAAAVVLPWVLRDLPADVLSHVAGCFVGSELLIAPEAVNVALAALHARATQTRKTGRRTMQAVAAALNDQTMYTIAVLCLTTTHRPTVAPFPHPHDISTEIRRAVIADKRVNQRSFQREVPLTEAAARQVDNYRQSIAAVAGFLDEMHPNLAGALRSLAEFGDQHPSAAAFSMLDHTDGAWVLRPFEPKDWARFWREWHWPTNGNRHVLTQWLQKAGVRREVISYLFGHAEPGQSPFHFDCAMTPQQFAAEITPFLEQAADAFGIVPLPPIPAYDRGAPPAAAITRCLPTFGDAAADRNKKRRLDAAELHLCRRVLRDASVRNEKHDSTRHEKIMALANEEFRDRPEVLALVIRLLTRWARTQGAPSSNGTPAPKKYLPFVNQGSPVTRGEIRDLVLGDRLRGAFIDAACTFIASPASAAPMAPATWLAYIHASAIALGGAHAAQFDRRLIDAYASDLYHRDGKVWVEWTQPERHIRWVFDDFTASLLAGFRKAFPSLKELPSLKSVRTAFTTLLASLSPFAEAHIDSASQRLKRFVSAIRALHREVVPGPLMAHMLGKRHSAPLPRSTLLRATGVRLVPSAPRSATFDAPLTLRDALPPTASKDVALTLLRKVIGKAQGSSKTGGKAAGKKGERLLELRANLAELESSIGGAAPVFQIVLSRLRELAEEGGRVKAVLATSTIAEYMQPVLKFAASELGKQFLVADPESIEHAYRTLVLSGCDSKACERLASLEDFHEHAVLHYGAVPVDWSEIAADLPQGRKHVNANILYPHEIALADVLISRSIGLPAHLVLMARAALHLMADTGMRFGEVFRLRVMDILGPCSYLFVRNTEHGEVKNFSGTRTIPIGCLLQAPGQTVLRTLQERALSLGNGDRLAPLCCDPRDARALVLRADVVRILAQALRLATGDDTIRPHHLRHTAVTASYDLLVMHHPDDSAWQAGSSLRSVLLGDHGPTRRSTQAHCQLFGHGGPDTSAVVYLHQQEFRVARQMSAQLPALTSKQVATLTGMTDAAVRKRRSTGTTTQALLVSATNARLGNCADLDAWRGLDHTSEPLELAMAVPFATDQISLYNLHRLLKSHHVMALPAEALSSLHLITTSRVQALLKNDHDAAVENSFAPGFADLTRLRPWAGYEMRTPNGLKTPPHLPSMVAIARMSDIPASPAHGRDASLVVRAFLPDQCCWEVHALPELVAVCHWLAAIGIEPMRVDITMPCLEKEVPDAMRKLAGPMANAAFTAVGPRANRRRGGETVRIRARPDNARGSATTIAYATYLWLVRNRTALATLTPFDVPQDRAA